MLTLSFAAAAVALLIGFFTKNALSIKTILPTWLFVYLLQGLILHALITNLEWLAKPKTPDPYIAFMILRNALCPLAVLIILSVSKRLALPAKAAVLVWGSLMAAVLEGLAERAGALEYLRWNTGLAALFWLLLVMLSFAFERYMDSLARGIADV